MIKQSSFLFVFKAVIKLCRNTKCSILLVLFFSNQSIFSQIEKSKDDYYALYDELFEIENSSLYNGIGHVERYRVINKYHKFYKTSDFLLGSLVHDGQYYPKIEMKYDLYEDIVLLNLKKGLRIVLLQPIKARIERFKIDGHNFKNINDSIARTQGISGFYEVLFDTPNFQLLEKHKKRRFERKGKNSVYSEFKVRNITILFYQGNYHIINNRNSLIDVFPNYKKKIQEYSRKRFPKTNRSDYLTVVCRKVYALISNANIQ